MNIRIIILLILVSFVLKTYGQEASLSGHVLDVKGEGIEFANVILENEKGDLINTGTITDAEGFFKLKIVANQKRTLIISFIGFEEYKKEIVIEQDFYLGKISLLPISNDLDVIVVTADRKLFEKVEDKLVFNVAASPLKLGYDGIEVLQRSPNVFVDASGNISMRNEAPTIMINGRISNLSGSDLSNFIRNIRSENIQKIEIQTHLSANAGAESSGGIINIVLKKNPLGLEGNLRSYYTFKRQEYRDAFAGFNWNYGAEKWNIYGLYNRANYQRQSEINNDIDYFLAEEYVGSEEIFKSNYFIDNAQLGLVTNISKNHILGFETYFRNLNHDSENDGSLSIFDKQELIEKGNALVSAEINNQLYTATLNYTWNIDTLSSSFKLFADYANQKVDRPSTTISTYENDVLIDNAEQNNSLANTSIYSLQTDLEKYLRSGFKIEAGAKVTFTERENRLTSNLLEGDEWVPTGRSNGFDYAEALSALYLSFNKNLSNKIFAEVGMRFENTDLKKQDLTDPDDLDQSYSNWFPNAYLSYELNEDKSISLSYSKRIRRPPFYFLNSNAIKVNDFRYELGNPDLIPENVHNLELSFKDKKQQFNLYLRNTTEAINGIYYLEDQIAFYQKFNDGVQQMYGLSYNRIGDFFDWWYINGNINLYNRKFISNGEDSFEQFTYRLSINNTFKLSPTLSIDLSAYYNSKYADAYYISFPYHSINIMLQKSFLDRKLNCRIYLNDVFNDLRNSSERPFENFRTTLDEKWLTQQLRLQIGYNFSNRNKVNGRKNTSKNDARRRL